jgi:hypothetical protein
MSLSASEQHALDSIEATLTSADPKLASLLAIFARLVSGEEMPVRERVRRHRRLQVTAAGNANSDAYAQIKRDGTCAVDSGAWAGGGPC